MTSLPFAESAQAPAGVRLPDALSDPGLLVGWSVGHRHPSKPIGFTYGDPAQTPATGFVDPIQLAREGHLITIAPTGAGKGRGCIIPALLQHDGPVIVIDPKGENTAVTARRRRELGQQVIVLDPMQVTDEPAASFNPFDLMDVGTAIAVDDAVALAGALWGGPIEGRDRFWLGRAQQVTMGLILHLLADRAPEERNLAGLRRLVALTVSDPEQVLRGLAESRHPEVRLVSSAFKITAPETLGGVMAFCQELVDFLRGPLVEEATSNSSFDVNGIARGDPFSIYLVLPPHMLESHGRLLRVWISTMLGAISQRRAKPPKPTLFILDEAAQLGPLAQLRQSVTLLRGYGVQTWSFWQDASQLQLHYPHDWQTMINNCSVVQCFGALTMNAAEGMAALTGIGTPDYVLGLNRGEMVLQLAGDNAIVARLPDYLSDPPFAGKFDPNPYHQNDKVITRRSDTRIELRDPRLGAEQPAEPRPKRPDEPDPLYERLLTLWRPAKSPSGESNGDSPPRSNG